MTDTSLNLPKATIKRIMKLNDDVSLISQEAVVATTKATELFIAHLAHESLNDGTGQKTALQLEDVLRAIESNQLKYEFLSEAFGSKSSGTIGK